LTALALAPHVEVAVLGDRGVVALRDDGHDVFSGAGYATVVRAVDGVRTAEDLIDATGAEEAVADLRRAGVLVGRDDALSPAEAAHWHRDGASPGRVAERLATVRVALTVAGDVDDAAVRRTLGDAGVTVGDDAALALVLTDDYLGESLAAYNEEALDAGRPWMLVRLSGPDAWLGPVVLPDRGPCWECLAQRLRRHRALELELRSAGAFVTARPPAPPSAAHPTAVAGMIAATLMRWAVLEQASGLHERLVSVDARTWETTVHTVVRRPQCAACGVPDPPEVAVARPIVLAAAAEDPPAIADDLFRAVAPEATVERYQHHVSPISGIADRLVRVTRARPPMHAYLSGALGPRRYGPDDGWNPGARTPPGGKGPTDAQARASALCEALERYSGAFGGEEPRLTGSLEELGERAVHPNAVMGFSERQYAAREEANRHARSGRTYVPLPFDPAAPVEWTPLWSLTAGRERLLPTAFCFYEARVAGRAMVVAESNGNAAGSTIEDAILQGLLELVERDHVAVWWYNRLRVPGVDLDAFAGPWLDGVRARFAEEERELWALDLTADLGIPAVVALAAAGRGEGPVAHGFGAHVDLGRALERAVSELIQLNAGVPSGGAGEGDPRPVPADHDYLLPSPDVPASTPDTGAGLAAGDLASALGGCIERIEGRGLEVMVLDQTRPDVGLPVVKVVVPGMRHFWPRFGPGRLYDVPVTLGLHEHPLAESELNPQAPVA
jgi:ribosomal protein S12 methylthiotransferase accessory factor